MFDIYNIVEALWIILPAYGANGLVTLFRGKTPVDFNRKFFDGERIFGGGKTWRGLIGGGIVGAIIGTLQMLLYPSLPFGISAIPLNIVEMTPLLGFFIGFGALFGDLIKSFLKRRLKIRRGQSWPVFDQDDFVLGGFLFAAFLVQIQLSWVIVFLIITPVIHLFANSVAFLFKIKKEPW